jgi:hypothetical protein
MRYFLAGLPSDQKNAVLHNSLSINPGHLVELADAML